MPRRLVPVDSSRPFTRALDNKSPLDMKSPLHNGGVRIPGRMPGVNIGVPHYIGVPHRVTHP